MLYGDKELFSSQSMNWSVLPDTYVIGSLETLEKVEKELMDKGDLGGVWIVTTLQAKDLLPIYLMGVENIVFRQGTLEEAEIRDVIVRRSVNHDALKTIMQNLIVNGFASEKALIRMIPFAFKTKDTSWLSLAGKKENMKLFTDMANGKTSYTSEKVKEVAVPVEKIVEKVVEKEVFVKDEAALKRVEELQEEMKTIKASFEIEMRATEAKLKFANEALEEAKRVAAIREQELAEGASAEEVSRVSQEKLEQLEAELKETRENLEATEGALKVAKGDLEATKEALNAEKQKTTDSDDTLFKFADATSKMKGIVEEYKNKLADNEKLVEGLQTLQTSLKADLELLKKQKEEVEEVVKNLEDEKKILQGIVNDKEVSIETLKQEISDTQVEFEQMRQDKHSDSLLIKTLQQSIINANRENEEIQKQLNVAKESKISLEVECSRLKDRFNELGHFDDMVEALKAEKEELTTKLEQTKADYDRMVKEVASFREKLEEKEKEATFVKADMMTRLLEYMPKLEALEKENAELKEMQAGGGAEASAEAKALIEEKEAEIESLRAKVLELEAEKLEMTPTTNNFVQQEDTAEEVEALKVRIEELMGQIEQLEAEKKELCDEFELSRVSEEEVKVELEGVQIELETAKADLEGVQTELDETKTELDETKTELVGVQEELADAKAELFGVQTELASKINTIDDMQVRFAAVPSMEDAIKDYEGAINNLEEQYYNAGKLTSNFGGENGGNANSRNVLPVINKSSLLLAQKVVSFRERGCNPFLEDIVAYFTALLSVKLKNTGIKPCVVILDPMTDTLRVERYKRMGFSINKEPSFGNTPETNIVVTDTTSFIQMKEMLNISNQKLVVFVDRYNHTSPYVDKEDALSLDLVADEAYIDVNRLDATITNYKREAYESLNLPAEFGSLSIKKRMSVLIQKNALAGLVKKVLAAM